MIFLGDLACPDEKIERFITCVNSMPIFNDEVIVLNLEGAIVDDIMQRRGPTLYNVSAITNAFCNAKKVIVSLANNHMYDYPNSIVSSKNLLESCGIGTFGLYDDNRILPYEFEVNGERNAFFGHCWKLYTKTNRNKVNSIRIVDCDYHEFIEAISSYKIINPTAKVYCFMHWNYDLEILPFPLYRTISRQLVDAGVEAVIGSHSHVPQGAEEYKGKMIAYCLGNFYIPSGIFFNGTLSYPAQSKRTYGVRFNHEKHDLIWFDTDTENVPVSFRSIEGMVGPLISGYSQFRSMDNKDYLQFFKQKRVNRKLVPVFGRYQINSATRFQELYAINRVRAAKMVQRIVRGNDA